MRFIMQFKSFPIPFVQKHLNREWNRGGGVNASGLLQLFMGMTAAGYLSDSVKDLVKNKTPKTAEDPSELGETVLQLGQQGWGSPVSSVTFCSMTTINYGAIASRTLPVPLLALLAIYWDWHKPHSSEASGIKRHQPGCTSG